MEMEEESSIQQHKRFSEKLPLVMLLLDGWGIAPESVSNIISSVETPFFDSLLTQYPCTHLKQTENTRNFSKNNIFQRYKIIGTGIENFNISKDLPNLLDQNYEYISQLFSEDHENFHVVIPLEVFLDHESHGYEFVNFLQQFTSKRILLHVITNSFDLKKKTALGKVSELHNYYKGNAQIYIASIHGRNYILNHDLDWDKTKRSFEAMINIQSDKKINVSQLESVYDQQNSYDNTIKPIQLLHKIKNYHVSKNDTLIFYNSSNENYHQIIQYINNHLPKTKIFSLLNTFGNHSNNVRSLLQNQDTFEPISRILSQNHIDQLKIAPARTFHGITHVFNNQRTPFVDEKWVPFTHKSSTTEQEAQKSLTAGIAEEILTRIENKNDQIIFASIPTLHLLSEQGNFAELKKEVKNIDKYLRKIVNKVLHDNGTVIITAPYGNAEITTIAHDENLTDNQATDSTVPFVIVNKDLEGKSMQNQQLIGTDLSIIKPLGALKDILPTILDFLNIEKTKNVQGKSLL